MTPGFKKIFDKLYERMLVYNNPFYFFGIPKADFSVRSGWVRLRKLNLEFQQQSGQCLLQGYPYALKLHESAQGRFLVDHEEVMLEIQGLHFRIHSAEELFILYEVFVIEVYRYCCNRDTVFIDVGMNSAITTLYYAKQPLVKKIYAFELFKPTFLIGTQNLKRNEACSQKVEAYNFGLSNRDFETSLDYSFSVKGRMGLKGLPADHKFSDAVKEEVQIKDIAPVFEDIISRHRHEDIVVKFDCEGEEYNLVERLSMSGLLEKLEVLMIEWHYIRPTQMENHLKQFDFHVFSQILPSLDSGMIYASRRH